ncbi:MAG TPA: glycoside hydrolase family 5 protein [Burkholderiaceae bacterium]|nr:glycoside hydrolase family 5 protein [Burkholderiaceae bacterium]
MLSSVQDSTRAAAGRYLAKALFACATVPLVAACGGGSSGTGTSSTATAGSPSPTPSPAPSPTPAPASIAGLHVVGNAIQNASGQPIVLHGVDKSGSEFACIQNNGFFDPPGSETDGTVAAIASWTGVNAVRVPMNEDCWLAINGAPAAYSGTAYQNEIKAFVTRLTQAGLVAILDLHWNAAGTAQATGQQPMPDADHSVTFWSQVAAAFKDNDSVIFDAYNEPYPDSNSDTTEAWRCWRDGGTCAGVSYQVAGMQQIVTAIRAAGANNVIMLGGVQYSNALSQWLAYKPQDPANNLAASWHMYGGNVCSSTTCWNQAPATVIAQVPVVAGEFGESTNGGDCSTTVVTAFTDWMDAHKGSYLAWSWNTWGGCLSLVSDTAKGTPTSTWGAFIKTRVAQ